MSNIEYFFCFYFLLFEPPEAKHVKRLTWIKIQTQTERNWDFPFDLEKMCSHFSTLLVFSHRHSDTVICVLGTRGDYFELLHEISLAYIQVFGKSSLCFSDLCSHVALANETQQKMKNEKRLSRWKNDSFIAIHCSGIQVSVANFTRQLEDTKMRMFVYF